MSIHHIMPYHMTYRRDLAAKTEIYKKYKAEIEADRAEVSEML